MIQEALRVFNLPFQTESIEDSGNYTLYRLRALNGSATLSRLSTRLRDIKNYTKTDVSIIEDNGVCLRVEKEHKTYLYTDYCGYLNKHPEMELPFMVGLTNKECIVEDLTKAPHLLVAGTTGSGKSNYLHTLINALLCGKSRVCMHLIDCKQVEFSQYEDNAYVVNDVAGANKTLTDILYWMDKRYAKMKQVGVNNFVDFRPYAKQDFDRCYHVVVVDELADLISTKQAKQSIVPKLLRIAQVGRASGFHLVVATQRPDHTVINGTLKGNIPTRICFNTASRVDSQIVLDRAGAEYLTGNGDGLFLKNGSRDLTRFQACYLPLSDIARFQ